MTISSYDVIIPASDKDFSKLPVAISKIKNNMSAENIYIVSPNEICDDELIEDIGDGVVYLLDSDVIPEKAFDMLGGPWWLFQQFFIKTFQEVTSNEWYIAMDADLFIMNNIKSIDDGTPTLFYSTHPDNHIKKYKQFNQALLGAKHYPYSVMNEIAVYNKGISQELIQHVGGMDEFIEKSASLYTVSMFPAEAQLYLSWLSMAHPSLYKTVSIKHCWRGMYNAYRFSRKQIDDTLANHSSDCDLYTLHSWSSIIPGTSSEYKA